MNISAALYLTGSLCCGINNPIRNQPSPDAAIVWLAPRAHYAVIAQLKTPFSGTTNSANANPDDASPLGAYSVD